MSPTLCVCRMQRIFVFSLWRDEIFVSGLWQLNTRLLLLIKTIKLCCFINYLNDTSPSLVKFTSRCLLQDTIELHRRKINWAITDFHILDKSLLSPKRLQMLWCSLLIWVISDCVYCSKVSSWYTSASLVTISGEAMMII